jgi:GNAT superfamily N-acetyltransferase
MTIEPVTTPDLPDFLPMLRAYCDFYEADPPDEKLRALAEHLIAHPAEGSQLIARDDAGEALGFATVYITWGTLVADRVAVMYDLFVRAEHRGKGAAEALIEACRALARERGAVVLTWQTAPDNLRAQAVYDRVGATREQWVDYWIATG